MALPTLPNRLARSTARAWALALAGAAFVAYCAIGTAEVHLGSGDYWEHLAAMRAFWERPGSPAHPHFGTDEPSHLLTPYHLFWALAARTFGVEPVAVLPVAAGCNAALLLWAMRRLGRWLAGTASAAPVYALTLLLFWYAPWSWSGFHALGLLPIMASYPYWFALPLALGVLASVGVRSSLAVVALAALAVPLVFLCHPLTGAYLCGALVLKALLGAPDAGLRERARILSPVLALPAALLWPYFPVWDAIAASPDYAALGFSGDYRKFYSALPQRLAPAALGLLALPFVPAPFPRRWLVGGIASLAAVYARNYGALHSGVLGRSVAFLILSLHLALATAVWTGLQQAGRRTVTAVLFGGALLLFGAFQVRDSVRWFSFGEGGPQREDLGPLTRLIGPEDVVLAPAEWAWWLPGLTGSRVASTLRPTPFMHDFAQRQVDVDAFFARGTSPTRRAAVARRYGATYVLVPAALTPPPIAGATLAEVHPAFALYRIEPER